MALTSPRFTSSTTLNKVAANQMRLQQGSEGRAVHLVQMALIDLGFAMPGSTSNGNYSPDGIYGEETKQSVKQFQKSIFTLTDDGIVGSKTLQQLDMRTAGFTHRVRLNFRSIALTNVPFQRAVRDQDRVCLWGIYFVDPRSARAIQED
jgi:peptidoglycan hydrolase-like protein with peptidoglycan-binding domain